MTQIKIDFNSYADYQDYLHSPIVTGQFYINRSDLIFLLCRYGGFRNISLSNKSINLYTALVDFIFDTQNNNDGTVTYLKSLDYSGSEDTFRNELSFIHGMIAGIIFAEHYLNVQVLLHLTDSRLVVVGDKSPDFFGIDNRGQAILLESKGSMKEVEKSTVKKGIEQVNGVNSVNDTRSSRTYSSFDKYVSASNFDSNDRYYINLVDPISKGKESIEFDFDYALYLHYKFILDCLKKEDTVKIKLNNIDYTTCILGKSKIGLNSSIFELLIRFESNGINNLYDKTNEILNESYGIETHSYQIEEEDNKREGVEVQNKYMYEEGFIISRDGICLD